MPERLLPSYRAFLSYSSFDIRWAVWLQNRLENFPLDKDLIGRTTSTGTIPATLGPIFRDRNDFTPGLTISDQTMQALDRSGALIVQCSRAAVRSTYVNEEIRLFKWRHPSRAVIPIIIDGVPNDPERECFPLALRFELNPDGTVSDRSAGVLAADLRDHADGRELALAKLVARLLGLGTDEVFRRAHREQRRRQRRWITGLSFVASLLAALLIWAEINRREAIAERTVADRNFSAAKTAADGLVFDIAQGLRDVEGISAETLGKILGRAEKSFAELVKTSDFNKGLLRSQSAMFTEFAETYGALGQTDKQLEAAKSALSIDEQLAKSEPANPLWQRYLVISQTDVGDVLRSQGDLDGALQYYESGLAISDQFTKLDPTTDSWQLRLSITYQRLGSIFENKGNLEKALSNYTAGLSIDKRRADQDPTDPSRQSNLASTHRDIANVFSAQSNISAALDHSNLQLSILQTLSQSHRGNTDFQARYGLALTHVGRLYEKQGNLSAALAKYNSAFEAFKRLTQLDPSNTNWQSSLSEVYTSVGDVQQAQGNFAAAVKSYEEALRIDDRLASADPTNTDLQSALSFSYMDMGAILETQGKQADALERYNNSLAIRKGLVAKDPTNIVWQNGLARAHMAAGNIQQTQGNLAEALESFANALNIDKRLAELDPADSELQTSLANTHETLGNVAR